MPTPSRRLQETPASANEKLRLIETPTFRLVPVPCDAIPGWNRRVTDWSAA
ncbi:hypothetical protein [Sphingomonas sp. BE137]|uniref:hypothetical protein n=1 Tax=Sphingomonas sp. BE137 TaxID=2817844 RepID=UPI001AE8A124|nr:hypothetical protein [Sphingomonas sp. BE137]MDR6850335.1 hypothetical protein [Sphingomonas sp. BE137]